MLQLTREAVMVCGHTMQIRYLWPEITRFEPKTNKGSLCLSSKVDLETVVANCKARNFDKKYLDLQQVLHILLCYLALTKNALISHT